MGERESLAAIIHEHIWGKEYPSDEADCCADAILASDWLTVHDARIREDANDGAEVLLGASDERDDTSAG